LHRRKEVPVRNGPVTASNEVNDEIAATARHRPAPLEVVRCGSISEASQRLNVASSAISRQISSLEETLDTVLFERRPRGMVLSAGGEMLAAHARKMALEADRVVADLQALKGLRSGRVRLSASEGFAIDFLPRVINAFQKKYPGFVFQLFVGAPAVVSRQVREGNADIGLTFARLPEPEIKVVHRQPGPIALVMRNDHPLARFRHLSLGQLKPYPDGPARPDHDAAATVRHRLQPPAGGDRTGDDQQLHPVAAQLRARQRCALHHRRRHRALPHRARGTDHAADPRLSSRWALRRSADAGRRTLPRSVEIFLDYLVAELSKDL
jgi:DNA-binding transcriptional LysR family regulator